MCETVNKNKKVMTNTFYLASTSFVFTKLYQKGWFYPSSL